MEGMLFASREASEELKTLKFSIASDSEVGPGRLKKSGQGVLGHQRTLHDVESTLETSKAAFGAFFVREFFNRDSLLELLERSRTPREVRTNRVG